MASMQNPFLHPKAIVEAGEKIYRETYQQEYEAKHQGKFVAIDIYTAKAFLGGTSEEALRIARTEEPNGVFHLIRVGSPGAFRVSYSDANVDWLFQ